MVEAAVVVGVGVRVVDAGATMGSEELIESRTRARIVGVLFIIATVSAVVGVSLINPLLDDSAYLANLASDETRVLVATLADLVTALSVAGVGVMLFPVLKKQDEGIALGYAAARTLEGAVIAMGAITSLLLLSLSREFIGTTAPAASDFEPLGEVLLGAREWTDAIGTMIIFSVTALLLYPLLYRSQLVPRFLSVWGFLGGVLLLVSGIRVLFGASPTATSSVLLMAPIGINEMVLAGWLIVKGFHEPTKDLHVDERPRRRMITGA